MIGTGYTFRNGGVTPGLMSAAGAVRQAMPVADNRPAVILQRKQINGRPGFSSEANGQASPHITVAQRKRVFQLARGPRRPGFRSNVTRMRKYIKNALNLGPYDMAHRMSYHDIREQVENLKGDPKKLNQMIRDITVPKRKFGKIKKGDKAYYSLALGAKKDPKLLVKILNSSPYNLRPGDQSTNRSIGARGDLHYEKKPKLKRTLTPQSKDLKKWILDNRGESSDIMSKDQFKTFEKGLDTN
ncbi:MAG: hypothetical protein NTW29_16875 [Bacteroidetes bacterium]|nr:hypothetical protein [Bacteroidota bacterium]